MGRIPAHFLLSNPVCGHPYKTGAAAVTIRFGPLGVVTLRADCQAIPKRQPRPSPDRPSPGSPTRQIGHQYGQFGLSLFSLAKTRHGLVFRATPHSPYRWGLSGSPRQEALLASACSVAGEGRSRRQEDGEIREDKNGQTTLHA